jgi:hypothetical protein
MIVDVLALIVAADIDLGYLWHVFKSIGDEAAAKEVIQKLGIFSNILNGVHELPVRLVGLSDPAEVPGIDLRLRTYISFLASRAFYTQNPRQLMVDL